MTVQNILRTIKKATTTPVQAAVKGNIPKWVNGSLYRNGPGTFEFNNKYYSHLFDGAACVNKYEINDGQVKFSNRFLDTKFYQKASTQKDLVGQFGTVGENTNIISRVKSFFKIPEYANNTNVTIFPYANKHLYAMTELNYITRLDPKDMSTISQTNISKYLDVKTNIAHPQILEDGGWINMGLYVDENKKGNYRFFKYQGGEKEGNEDNLYKNGKMIASVPSNHADGVAYYHSFGLSENYIIFLESPIKMVFKNRLKNAVLNKPTLDAFETDQNFPTYIHIINQHTGEVLKQKFKTDAQFTFHHMNAYEEVKSDDLTNLIVDVCSFDTKHFNLHNLTYKNINEGHLQLSDKSKSLARRIEVPIKKSAKPDEEIYCEIKDINDYAFEFPTINYDYNTKPYKYVYGTNSIYSTPFTVCKLDVQTGEMIKVKYAEEGINVTPSEAIFVPNPDGTSEDDGVLLVMVLSDKNDYLSVLDAKDLTEIGRADLPNEVKSTFTFHGFFADKAKMFA